MLGAKVTAVTVKSATSATVTYSITTASGSTLLPNQHGTAVYEDGIWKVGDASLCGLFKLIPGGTLPSACSSAGRGRAARLASQAEAVSGDRHGEGNGAASPGGARA